MIRNDQYCLMDESGEIYCLYDHIRGVHLKKCCGLQHLDRVACILSFVTRSTGIAKHQISLRGCVEE